MQKPLIFDIKRYAINDGPGIRVTVFFKGCPLNCQWCHNPESISARPQKLFTAAKCIGCRECCRVCPRQACELNAEGVVTNRVVCTLCGACAAACPAMATEISGRPMAVEEILEVIEKERPFFDQSAGGVTFSGGEPLLYPDFLIELLDRCGARGIHRAIDTSGYVKTATLLEVARHADLFLYDLKLIDNDRHRHHTGVENQLILNNLAALAATGVAIQVRVPLLGGVNDDAENLAGIADFVAGLAGSRKEVNLLPYHDVARGKDAKLGQHRDLHAIHEPGPEGLERAIRVFGEHGLRATVGG